MLVICNKRIPEKKRILTALTYLFGVGDTLAKKITFNAGITDNKKVFELSNDEVDRLVRESEKHVLEDKLREDVQKRKNEKIYLGTYQGRRLEKGLPVHGQSTRHNSRTAKKNRVKPLSKKFSSKDKKIKKLMVKRKKKK